MAIYTKKGDEGMTSLVSGKRVYKNDQRVEAYGDVDELISYLGLVRCYVAPAVDSVLSEIQDNLMMVSAWLACDVEVDKLPPIQDSTIDFLEKEIDKLTAILPQKNSFIIPGPPVSNATCHVARTICRRAERKVVSIETKHSQDLQCQKYLNRLSDYLFMLARFLFSDVNKEEEKWIP